MRKRELVAYYVAVAPLLLPHLRGRPFTFRQHFNGSRSPFRWLKDAPPEAPGWLRVAEVPAAGVRPGLRSVTNWLPADPESARIRGL